MIGDDAEIHLWSASDDRLEITRRYRDQSDLCRRQLFIAGTASCRIAVEDVNDLYVQLRASEVLHSPSTVVENTGHGTRESRA